MWRDAALVLELPDPSNDTSGSMQREACSLYLALTQTARGAAASAAEGDPSLGGQLLYAGEADWHGRARVIAGNVAGCATLAATADAAAQKQSIRDGVVDFLVNSLDEALRILKNEVRQRKTVSVCVGAAPEIVERQMIERGVQPDQMFAALPDQRRILLAYGSGTREIKLAERVEGMALLTWQVKQIPARWMPKLDAVVLESLPSGSWESRWIRLSPRYFGRAGFAQRALYCEAPAAKEILRQFTELVQEGAIGTEISGSLAFKDESTAFRLKPDALQNSVQDS